jgi:hypothetical protein
MQAVTRGAASKGLNSLSTQPTTHDGAAVGLGDSGCSERTGLPHREGPQVRAAPAGGRPGGTARSIDSSAGSRESQNVPQRMGTITRAPTSQASCTASSGFMCIVHMNQRGSYAPIGSFATSIPGYRAPIEAKKDRRYYPQRDRPAGHPPR